MITGRGHYVDDMVVAGMLYMAVVRSPRRCARITSIDTSAAKALPGIHGVFFGADLDLAPGCRWRPGAARRRDQDAEHWPLAKDEVKYVGQGVAVVVGEDKYAVVDAAEQVLIDYDPLPVVVDPEKALEDGSALVQDLGTNQVHEWSIGGGDMDAAWAEADVVSSAGSSTTAPPARRSSRACASPTTAATSSRCTCGKNPHPDPPPSWPARCGSPRTASA